MLSVLLIEPHPDTRELYGDCLRRAGMEVHEAECAGDARPLVPQCQVVVMESLLPGEPDAFSFIRELRRRADSRDIPIVVVSASGAAAEQTARDAGCNVFLSKPCLPEQLHLELFRIERHGAPDRMVRVPTTRAIRDLLRRLG